MQSVLNKKQVAIVLLALFALTGGAGAATISPSISSCTVGFTIKANGEMECAGQAITSPCVGNVVLDSKGAADCSVALPKPTCSLTPVTSSIALGNTVTLTANCTPEPESYIWTGGNCVGKTTSCTVTGGQSAGTTTYTVKGRNASGEGTPGSANVTVTASTTPITPPTQPNCHLTQRPFGSKIWLDANCDAAKYVWVGTEFSEQAKGGFIDPPAVPTTYSVTGYNSAGAVINTSSLEIIVSNSCTLTATPPSIALGESAELKASCTPAATSYNWNGAVCQAGTANDICIVTPAVAGTPTYTVTGIGTNTASATQTVTVTGPSCQLTATPPAIIWGEESTLKASCTPAATSYNWNGAVCKAGTANDTCIVTPAAAGTATYTVTGIGTNTTSATKTVTVTAPFCTLTVSPDKIGLGDTATLKASCTPAATSYNWNGAVCKAGTANDTCIVTPAVAGTPTYTVTGIGTNTASDTKTATVTAPFCELTATPSTLTLGASSTLTARCSPAASGYNWNGAGCAVGTAADTCVVTPTTVEDVSYTVTGVGNNTASSQVKVSVTGTQCSVKPVTWGPGLAAYGDNPGGTPKQTINATDIQAYEITLPDRSAQFVKINYGNCRLELTVSQKKCDFSPELRTQGCQYGPSIDPLFPLQTKLPAVEGACLMPPDKPLYFNVRQPAESAVNNCRYYLSY